MSEMADDRNGGRISISEDKLYRALTELELRLIRQLASQDEVRSIERRLSTVEERTRTIKEFHDELDRLNKTQAALKATILNPDRVAALIQQALRENEARGWTQKERLVGLGLAFVTLASFLTNLFVAVKKY